MANSGRLYISFLLIFMIHFFTAGNILDSIFVDGVYRMRLTTGDEFEGTVTVKDDSSIVIESDGKPYRFKGTLIKEIKTLAYPPVDEDSGSKEVREERILGYKELLHRGGNVGKIRVSLANGSVFIGAVSEIDSEHVRLDIEGSIIPIHRDVVKEISTVTVQERKEEKVEKEVKKEVTGPYDTIFVKAGDTRQNQEQELIWGKIISDDVDSISIRQKNGKIRKYPKGVVHKVIRHTVDNYRMEIKRYAKTLFCPDGMILVDIPPGKEGRPFFKVCIDKYEYPNIEGRIPYKKVSYEDAKKACKQKGKRLCTVEEWKWACSGLEDYTYPYGWHLEKDVCNTNGVDNLEKSGFRRHCESKFGVYDMTGNIFEWVTGMDGSPKAMGGPYSKCATVSPGLDGEAKKQIGFRCCKSN